MFGIFKKNERGSGATTDLPYRPRASTHANAPRTFNNAKPVTVDTKPIVVDATDQRASFWYREGRDPEHQYSRVTTPLNFNPSFGNIARMSFVPGAKIGEEAEIAVPRRWNRGMQPVPARTNQYRPTAGSYGAGSENPVTTQTNIDPRLHWML